MSVAVIGGLLISGVLTANPAQAASVWDGDEDATSELTEVELPGEGKNKNLTEGGASELSAALDEAATIDEPVVVDALQSPTEQYIANPDGTVTRELAQAPVRVKEGDEWVDIDPELVRADGRLEPKATANDVTFSGDGGGSLAELQVGDEMIGLSLRDIDLSTPKLDGAVATYDATGTPEAIAPEPVAPEPSSSTDADAAPQAEVEQPAVAKDSVRVAVKNRGFAAHVILDAAPAEAPEYVFDLVTGGLTPSLEDGVLTLDNADGKAVAQSLPLRMWDAQVDEAGDPTNVTDVDASLERVGDGWQLTLTPSMDFLSADDTEYPVTVDPDISAETSGDSYFSEAEPNTSFGGEPRILVGHQYSTRNRGFVAFPYNDYLGATVTDAKLELFNYSAAVCTEQPMAVHSMTGGDSTGPRWANQPAHSTDARFMTTKSFAGGRNDCGRDTEAIDVTGIVSAWAGAQEGPHSRGLTVHRNRQAFILRAPNETANAQWKRFCSAEWSTTHEYCTSAAVVPKLSVTFEPEIGEQGWYSMTDRELDERTTLKVNNKNANLFIAAKDLNVKGIGLDLSIDRTYNSQSDTTGPMGRGWSLNMGPDVWLEKMSQYRYNLHAPGGTVLGSFVRRHADSSNADYKKFRAPLGGVGSELEETSNGFVLTYRKSQEKFVFNQTNSDGDAFMTKQKDRSDNEITVAYSGTAGMKPKISSVTDTVGRVITPTYTGDVITKWATENVAGVGVREWDFTYANGYLASATDALGAKTDYTYIAGAGSLRFLSQITAPANDSATRPTTHIGYKEPANADIDIAGRVSTVDYRFGDGANDFYRYSWNLNSGRVAACDGNGDVSTEVRDPRGNTTTYCYTQRNATAGDAKTWVYDALENLRSQDYNSDNQPLNATAPSGQGTGGASTTNAYATNISDQLTSVTAPRSDASSSGDRSTMRYGGAAAKPGGNYLPDTVSDGSGDCNSYEYDSKGRTEATFTGLAATSSGCSPKDTSRGFHRDFNDNGTLHRTWDANVGQDKFDEDKTAYTYWKTTDAGYVAGSKDQVKTIRKPGGDCSTGASRRLCTSYTYDGAGRVLTVTDGRGTVTTYTYDKNDRKLNVYLDGTTGAQCGGIINPFATCIGYEYDAAGNMITRTEGAGQTNFSFDRLNRMTAESPPHDGVGKNRIDYTYDAVGNMTGYSQQIYLNSADVTTYTYDAANQPKSVTSAVGTFDLRTDNDGRLSGITFPNPNNSFGLDVSYEYTRAGKPKKMDWKFAGGTRAATWTYSYKNGSADTPQMRERVLDVNGTNAQEGTTKYKYDEKRLTSAIRTGSTAPYSFEYTYDKVGNILSEKVGSTTTHHGYNRAGERCWTGTSAGTDSQQLDRTCNPGPSGSTNFTHDKAGNNTGTSSSPIAYNEKSQVTEIAGTTQGYLGEDNNYRHNRGSDRFLSGQLGLTQAGSTHYTRAPDGTVLASRTGGVSTFYVTEPNGHVAYLTDVNGASIGGYDYSPFGKATVLGSADNNRIRYLGEYQETNNSNGDQVYKFGARYYTTSGAFTQPDAVSGNLSDPRTMTAYNYAGGDPINQHDASGYFLEDFLVEAYRSYERYTFVDSTIRGLDYLRRGQTRDFFAEGANAAVGGGTTTLCLAGVGRSPAGVGYCAGIGTAAGQSAANQVRYGRPYRFYGEK